MTISATTQGLRPGVCTSTSRPSTPFDGMMIYETDTDRLAIWNGTAWTYVTGTKFIEWTSFTPTWTNLTAGNATQSFAYSEHGNTMFIEGRMTLGSTSSVGTNPSFAIPNSRTSTGFLLGGFLRLEDTGTQNYFGQLLISTVSIELYNLNVGATYPTLATMNSTTPHTWASTDVIHLGCSFRIN